ncbi:hypothetical protein TNCT6_00570 [Streptomyces sp. 6-11-2]|nr:hypothetical protein TNCT6_00570 [Streptomyces sp. 6-11-2]
MRSVSAAAFRAVSSTTRRASAVPSIGRAWDMVHSWAFGGIAQARGSRLCVDRSPVVLHLSASHGPASP